jgi:hypothetical protein
LGISSKNDVSSTSLEVEPQDMSMLKKWQSSACETWREIPPRKMVRRISHLKFSKTGSDVSKEQFYDILDNLRAPKRLFCDSRYRRIARATFPTALKTMIKEK